MKRWLLLIILVSPCAAQTYFGVNGWCTTGAQATVTQGLSSSGTKPISGGAFSQSSGVLASYPKCTVTVYDTGTTNISTIYSNTSGNVLSNPFTGATDGSFLFFGIAGCYDVVTSSGVTTGSTMPASKTYSGVCIGIGGSGSVNCPTALNGSIAAFSSPAALSCDPNFSTDFHGNTVQQSATYVGPVNGFYKYIGGGSDPGSNILYKLPANSVGTQSPLTAGTPWWWRWPSTKGAVGQVPVISGQSNDSNGDPVNTISWLTPSGGSVCTTPDAQSDIWVDTAGNDSTGDGTNGNPYLTVGRAFEDIPVVVCQKYVIHLKSVGTYSQTSEASIDSKIFYSGGGGLDPGTSSAFGNWPYEQFNGSDQVSNWIEVVGAQNPGSDTGVPGNVNSPKSYVIQGLGRSNGEVFFVSHGFLAFRGVTLANAQNLIQADHSTVGLFGVIFKNYNVGILATGGYVWLDQTDGTSFWCDPARAGECLYFDGTGTTAGESFLLMDGAIMSDHISNLPNNSPSVGIEAGKAPPTAFYGSKILLQGFYKGYMRLMQHSEASLTHGALSYTGTGSETCIVEADTDSHFVGPITISTVDTAICASYSSSVSTGSNIGPSFTSVTTPYLNTGQTSFIYHADKNVMLFADLPACTTAIEGATNPISDSATTTWGATITAGSNHVLAYCNGTDWTVAAK